MARDRDFALLALQALRRQGGVLASAELQAALGVSQPWRRNACSARRAKSRSRVMVE